MSRLQLFGVPLSQPVRAVAWACLQKRLAFDFKMVVPGLKTKGGSAHADFLALNPLGTVPAIRDGEMVVGESSAILGYLGDTYVWRDLYPSEPSSRTRIHEYCAWHQANTRSLAALFGPKVRPDMAHIYEEKLPQLQQTAARAVTLLDEHWLEADAFIGNQSLASIADLLAYEELATVAMCELLDLSPFPKVSGWLKRMAALPYHDEAHAALSHLGSLSKENDTPMPKRLAAASKAGLAAMAAAQP